MKYIQKILLIVMTGFILFLILGKIQDKYLTTPEVKNSTVESIIAKIITPSMNDYEKVKAVHDYIVLETDYDIDNLKKDTIPAKDYTAQGVLKDHIGVCRGYAEAFQLLMDKLNIECEIESGYAGEITHAWNNVKIDGEWYQIDVTYDDPISNEEISGDKSNLRYDYFLITSEQIYLDHTTKKALHDCVSEKYMYQEKEQDVPYTIISSAEGMVPSFLGMIKKNTTAVTFYFPNEIDLEKSGIMQKLATSLSAQHETYDAVYHTPARKCGKYYYTTVSVE